MKLRNFLYLNTKIVEDYISAIDGYTYDEEAQTFTNSSENAVNGSIGIKVVSGEGLHNKKASEEIKRSAKINDAARFDRLYNYLQTDSEDEILKYYESISDEAYNDLNRDDFIEVLATVRFSKAKELTSAVKKVADLASVIQEITDQPILDKETTKAINGFAALEKLNSKNEISCVFEFSDGHCPLIAFLDESYFRCKQDNFVGQAYVFCKITRKIDKGNSVKLDELFDDIKNIPFNREQRRKMPKNMDNPNIMRDVIKGPAIMVIPIAVYQ